jgi:hypothetical protein
MIIIIIIIVIIIIVAKSKNSDVKTLVLHPCYKTMFVRLHPSV